MSGAFNPQDHFGEKHVGKAVREAIEREHPSSVLFQLAMTVAERVSRTPGGAPTVPVESLPNLKDMSADSITENVLAINSMCKNPRQKFVLEALVRHLHDFTREVSLTSDEWM